MKHKINKKTITLANTLTDEYRKVYEQVVEAIDDKDFTRPEINFFIRKSTKAMIKAMEEGIDVETFTSHNMKKYAIEENKTYKTWHEGYVRRMRNCDRVTNSSYIAVIFYSITLVAVSAFMNGGVTNWLWMIVPGLLTCAFLARKILLSRKMKLSLTHTYGDIIMFVIVTIICALSTYYFMVFLWVYDLAFMIYLQLHIVEEDI